ncbi:unnamed protein product [Sphagnum jensenii]|uniref:Uncharacterized protein n=1 Tax=Sphagnum jensenii TaxID=128206 RepID=A0ABP0VFG1_9BRYO
MSTANGQRRLQPSCTDRSSEAEWQRMTAPARTRQRGSILARPRLRSGGRGDEVSAGPTPLSSRGLFTADAFLTGAVPSVLLTDQQLLLLPVGTSPSSTAASIVVLPAPRGIL